MDKETLVLIFQIIIMLISLFFFFLTLDNKRIKHRRLRMIVTTLAAAGIIFKLGKDVAWTLIFFGIILLTQIAKKNGTDRLDHKKLGGDS